MINESVTPTFFATPSDFRDWMEAHHTSERVLWVGYYKVGAGKPSITWPQSVDVALCFGWIDGVRYTVDASSYRIRFTPRQARSTWSVVNVRRMTALLEQGLVQPAGLAAWEARTPERTGLSSFEQATAPSFDAAFEQQFRADPVAWAGFQAMAPWYRRAATHWVMSAKRPETRARRLATLIADSAAGRTIAPLTRPVRGS